MMDFDAQEQLAEERRRRFAAQLAGAQQAPQGQMVGRHFVAPNALQYAAQALRGFGGMRGEQLAEQELGQIRQQRTEGTQRALADFLRQSQGTPENAPSDGMGPVMPAQASDMRGAYAALMQSPSSMHQAAGFQGQLSMAQQQAQATQQAAERQRLMAILTNSTPQEAIAAGVPPELVKNYYESRNFGRDKVEFKDVGGQLVPVTNYGDRPEGVAPIQKTGNPFSDLVTRNLEGQIVPNQPLVDVKGNVAKAGRPQINVDARNFSTQESEQSKVYGRGLGEQRTSIMNAGIEAPRRLASLDRMEQLLQGIEGGRLAPAMTDVASALNSVGITVDPKLGQKEASEALAVEMALKMRPPGSGPMTDKDFENFLRTAPSLAKSAAGRAQITSTIRAAIQRDIEAANFMRQYAEQNGGVIDDRFFQALQDFYIKNPVVTPSMPAANSRGAPFRAPSGNTANQAIPDDINSILQLYAPGAR
jgi:hypothetical protein